METYFEIIDSNGVVNSPIDSLDEALSQLQELKEDGFEFTGSIKIIKVYLVE